MPLYKEAALDLARFIDLMGYKYSTDEIRRAVEKNLAALDTP